MDDTRPWWLWPNLLSLDAPAVAVVWQSFLADAEGVDVPVAAIGALALVAWAIYLSDRWLDVRGGRHRHTDRHRFAARNRWAIGGIAMLAMGAALIVAVTGLSESYLEVGGIVGVLFMAYFTVVHAVARRVNFKGFKEVSSGAVFAVGVAIPLIAGAPRSCQAIAAIISFGGLCVLNCILISRWEETPGTAPSVWTALAATVIAAVAAVGAKPTVAAAVLVSLGFLIGLCLTKSWISTRGLRVLADAVLFTPIFVVVLV